MLTDYVVFYYFLALALPFSANCINWTGNWAFACDFTNNDMGNARVRGEDCGGTCERTPGCTHFSWTPYEGGTCWMKSGGATKNDAHHSDEPDIVCGVVEGQHNGDSNSGGGGDDGCGSFALDGLNVHNKYRAIHGSPPLRLKKEICDWAQEWANQLANDGNFRHRENNKYGENLFMSWSDSGSAPDVTANGAVDSWYNEISQYTFGTGFSMETGHFTQLVWKASSELGMAKASANGRTVVVANYSPHGNVEGQYPENVLPPQP